MNHPAIAMAAKVLVFLCSCDAMTTSRQDSSGRAVKPEVERQEAVKASSGDKKGGENASLSLSPDQRVDCPIIIRIKYVNLTKNIYKYTSFASSPHSFYFYALLTMPNGEQERVRIYNGVEYLCGSFAQVTTIGPGSSVEWVYVLTLGDLNLSGMYLHPSHWSFAPGKYAVNVCTSDERGYCNDILPNIATPKVSFNVQDGSDNSRVLEERDALKEWKRRLQKVCINELQYQSLVLSLESSDGEKRKEALSTLCCMTSVGLQEHAMFIKMWQDGAAKYLSCTDPNQKQSTIGMLGRLHKILRKMNTKEARDILSSCDDEIRKDLPFIGGG